MAERLLQGRPCAPGLARGVVVALGETHTARRVPSGDPATEQAALRTAIADALAETSVLAASASGDAADMIAFQAAMLEDDELARPAFAAIADGAAADRAWEAAMDAEIAGYAAAEDAYFRARTADLQDIRDRVLARLRPQTAAAAIPPGAIIAASDLPLSRFLAIDWGRERENAGAILLTQGSPTGHVAMLARARGVPMVAGLGGVPAALDGVSVLVDAAAGVVTIDPAPATLARFSAQQQDRAADAGRTQADLRQPARTADGTPIATQLNIVGAADVAALDPAICDGIGLFRTEFLFYGRDDLPDEDTQYAAYRAVAAWAQGRPITIRTLDAGGDKPVTGLTVDGESNPFLGLRGIRLSLRHPDLFGVQLRALVRAARHGRVRIMLPMVTIPAELEAARALLDAAMEEVASDGLPTPRPDLGIMVEVPAAAIAIDQFDAAFFSIGSNDLTQYVTAAGRDMGSVADLADPLNPAVLRLIEGIVRHGRRAGREVSLCGDAGGDPAVLPALLAAGLRSVSVAPALLAGAKRAIGGVTLPDPAP